jgi:signal transduction histidine kinase
MEQISADKDTMLTDEPAAPAPKRARADVVHDAYGGAGVVFLCDAEGLLRRVQHDALGVAREVAPGTRFVDLVDPGSCDKAAGFVEALRRHLVVAGWELGLRGSGGLVVAQWAGCVIEEGLLLLGHTAGPTRDTHDLFERIARLSAELMSAERELARRNDELSRLNEMKDFVLAVTAHDLRSPVANVVSYVNLIDATRLDPEDAHYVAIILRNAEFMVRLIDDLMDLASLQSGGVRLDLRPTDLRLLLESNAALNQRLAGEKQMKVKLTLPADVPAVDADPQRVEQVLNNLVSNAVKFAPFGSEIHLQLEQRGRDLVVSVRDEGPGIPVEEQRKLFQPFGRTTVRTSGGEKSTGLGLAIAKRIVVAHRGEIWVKSEPGKGSTFHFSLPLS